MSPAISAAHAPKVGVISASFPVVGHDQAGAGDDLSSAAAAGRWSPAGRSAPAPGRAARAPATRLGPPDEARSGCGQERTCGPHLRTPRAGRRRLPRRAPARPPALADRAPCPAARPLRLSPCQCQTSASRATPAAAVRSPPHFRLGRSATARRTAGRPRLPPLRRRRSGGWVASPELYPRLVRAERGRNGNATAALVPTGSEWRSGDAERGATTERSARAL